MRRLTDEERIALREIGPPDEGPVSDATFTELVQLGWGRWALDLEPEPGAPPYVWTVTEAGRRALALDDAAKK